jgi:hypothetical protein
MGSSEKKKDKSLGKKPTDKKVEKKTGIPSDQTQTVQIVLDYLFSLGLTSVCKKLEESSGLKAVRLPTQFNTNLRSLDS